MPSLRKRPYGTALAALALALVVFAVASLPAAVAAEAPAGQPAPAIAGQSQADDLLQQVLALTNQERARQGLPALSLDPTLCRSAEAHGQDMASHNFFSHTGSDGSTVDQRIKAAGYAPLWAYGENIAAGQRTPEEVVKAWMNSEGHRANILSPHFADIGLSYVYQPGTTYLYYWTQDFASHTALEVQPAPTPLPAPMPTRAAPASPTPRPTRRPTLTPTPTRALPTPTPTPSPLPYNGVAVAATAAPPLPALAAGSYLGPTTTPDRAQRLVELLNQVRAGAGRPALALDPALDRCAQAHSADMAGHSLLSHTGSDGSTAAARLRAAGFGPDVAEAIAGGQATPEDVVAAWMADPSLRERILEPGLARAGVGYAYSEESRHRHYWTLDLAQGAPAPVGWLQRWVSGLLRLLGL